MKKTLYAFLAFCVVCIAMADDHIIQFVLSNGQHVSYRTSDVQGITYDYHDQDSIDQAYADSVAREEFVRDSIAREEFVRDSLYRDSVERYANAHTLNLMVDSTDRYTIFTEALRRTGLIDSVATYRKDMLEFVMRPRETYSGTPYPANERQCGFTIFAEPDSVLRLHGINSIDDLVSFANNTYGTAKEWYDYLQANNLEVSTGEDYTSRQNALNMFVAYHILPAAIAADWIVFERGSSTYWNYAPDADPYDYYETMLPCTLLKAWAPHTEGKKVFLNRYQTNNTLTNEVGTMGTNHELIRTGAEVLRNEGSVEGSNGYIHPIGDMLVYDKTVPQGVLNERVRVNCTSLMPELTTNGWRSRSAGDGSIPSDYDTSRIGIPNKYSGNMVVYADNTCMVYCLHGAWSCYQSDQLQIWGRGFDVAVKLPSLPAGTYELRIPYYTVYNYNGVLVEYSVGTNPYATDWTRDDTGTLKVEGFEVIDTVDYSIYYDDPRIGLTNALEEEDRGVASDQALRERGYMRAPYSYCGHAEIGWSIENNCRNAYSGYGTIRKILGRVQTDGQQKWLRIRSLIYDTNPVISLDYIELVPVALTEQTQYMEDWY